jgi:hypothetical protein
MTAVYKFVLPAMWISVFGFVTFWLFSSAFHGSGGGPPPPVKWIFLVVWVIGTAVWYRCCIPLKRVSMNGGELIVSNYAREIRVPLRRIRRISESRFQNPRSIKLAFDEDLGFGASIVFIPAQIFLWRWQEHPIARQLRQLSNTDL